MNIFDFCLGTMAHYIIFYIKKDGEYAYALYTNERLNNKEN